MKIRYLQMFTLLLVVATLMTFILSENLNAQSCSGVASSCSGVSASCSGVAAASCSGTTARATPLKSATSCLIQRVKEFNANRPKLRNLRADGCGGGPVTPDFSRMAYSRKSYGSTGYSAAPSYGSTGYSAAPSYGSTGYSAAPSYSTTRYVSYSNASPVSTSIVVTAPVIDSTPRLPSVIPEVSGPITVKTQCLFGECRNNAAAAEVESVNKDDDQQPPADSSGGDKQAPNQLNFVYSSWPDKFFD